MEMTFRWYGQDDPVKIEYIRQIPGMKGIVTAIYDIPVGEVWPLEKIMELKASVEKHGLELSVIESVPVHEDIKLGLPTRDKYIANYCQLIYIYRILMYINPLNRVQTALYFRQLYHTW